MRVFAPFGFYGAGNTGDEATLQGFARLLQISGADLKTTLVSQNARHTARVEPHFRYVQDSSRRSLAHRIATHAAQAYVFAGGTPIQDGLGGWPLDSVAPMIRHAARWNKPVAFIGVGVEHLSMPRSQESMRSVIASYVACWTVRSANDRDRLIGFGVPANKVTVAADMAWLLPPAEPGYGEGLLRPRLEGGGPLIGVNINAESAVVERAPRQFEELAAGLDTIIDEHGARVVFLFNETRAGPTYDVAAAERVRSAMRRSDATFALPNNYLAPSEMMSLIGNCALTIGSRYHFCLFAALQGVPFLALKRSDKVSDLCADLHWRYGAAPEEANAANLAEQARALLTRPQPALRELEQRIGEMKTRALLNARGLDQLRAAAAEVRRSKALTGAIGRVFNRAGGKPA